jgi:serine/threonine protein kinase
MLTGSKIGVYEVGQKIGQGGFGEIYVAKNTKNKKLYAIKTEQKNSPRKTLEFESRILKEISKFDIFPRFFHFGKSSDYLWLSMELLGPSLSSIIKQLPEKHLSIKCGVIVGIRVLKSIQLLHDCGFIHRDIKPGNVLIRRSLDNPVALIDFGLSRIYIDGKTGKHLPARAHPGFRGTAVYAAPNAHMHQDLSRRDDMISWFYFMIDILCGKLPWKHLQNKSDILHLKRRMNIEEICDPIAPELVTIWRTMSNMAFADRPDYERIVELLNDVLERNKNGKRFDWHPNLFDMEDHASESFCGYETKERSVEDTGGVSVDATQKKRKASMKTPLLSGFKTDDCFEDDNKFCCECKI